MVSISSGVAMNRLLFPLYRDGKGFSCTRKQENQSVSQRRLIDWY